MRASLSCPGLSFTPLKFALREVTESFDGMEILAEEMHDAEYIKNADIKKADIKEKTIWK